MGTCWEQSENMLGTVWEHAGNSLGTCREQFANMLGVKEKKDAVYVQHYEMTKLMIRLHYARNFILSATFFTSKHKLQYEYKYKCISNNKKSSFSYNIT